MIREYLNRTLVALAAIALVALYTFLACSLLCGCHSGYPPRFTHFPTNEVNWTLKTNASLPPQLPVRVAKAMSSAVVPPDAPWPSWQAAVTSFDPDHPTVTVDGGVKLVSWYVTDCPGCHVEYTYDGTNWMQVGNVTANDGLYFSAIVDRPGQQFRIRP